MKLIFSGFSYNLQLIFSYNFKVLVYNFFKIHSDSKKVNFNLKKQFRI